MIVDVEHHFTPREIWEKRGGRPGKTVMQRAPDGTPLRPLDDSSHDISIHLKNMDLAGIDIAVLSGAEATSIEEALVFNDALSRVVRQHPGRCRYGAAGRQAGAR